MKQKWKDMEKRLVKMEEEKSKTWEEEREEVEEMVVKKLQEKENCKKESDKKEIEKLIEQKVKENRNEKYESFMKKQEEELEKLKWGREMDERRERRNNIIIKGIGKRDIKDGDEVKKWFKEELNLEVEVDGFWHIGDKSAKEYRLGVRMHDWENKQRVMGNKSKLRGKEDLIFIDNDLTQKEKKVRRVIAEEIKRAGEIGILLAAGRR